MNRKKYGNFLRNYSMLFIIGAFINYKSTQGFRVGDDSNWKGIKKIKLGYRYHWLGTSLNFGGAFAK